MKLFNRDKADLNLVQHGDVWKLEVDKEHEYVLEYMRIIGKPYVHDISDPSNWEAIDPSGGPYITIGTTFEDNFNNKYKVVGFKDATTLIMETYEGNTDS